MNQRDLIIWATRRAKTTHNAFLRNTSADNWREAVESMLVYQQAEYLLRSDAAETQKLLLRLESWSPAKWPEIICEAAGCSLSDALG